MMSDTFVVTPYRHLPGTKEVLYHQWPDFGTQDEEVLPRLGADRKASVIPQLPG